MALGRAAFTFPAASARLTRRHDSLQAVSMKQALKYIGVFILWNLAAGSALLFAPPIIALPLSLGLSALLLWGYLLRPAHGKQPARRWAALRLRPLRGDTLIWSLAAVPILLVLSWSLGDVYTQLVPVPSDSLNPFGPMLGTWEGRLVISIFAIAVAPIVEEFIFRGLVQNALERRYGSMPGLVGSAGFFAFVHLLPWVFPIHFFLGLAFGYAVWATRSIWTGVMLHAANNAAAIIGLSFFGPEPAPTGTLWQVGASADLLTSVAALAASGAAAYLVAGKLRGAGQGQRLRRA